MGFHLGVWDADKPPRVAEAQQRYDLLTRGQDAAATPSARIDAVADECGRRWTGGEAIAMTRSPSALLVDLEPDEATALFGAWAEMAERHGVVLYDPQSGVVVIPSRLSFAAEPPEPGRPAGGLRSLLRRRSRP